MRSSTSDSKSKGRIRGISQGAASPRSHTENEFAFRISATEKLLNLVAKYQNLVPNLTTPTVDGHFKHLEREAIRLRLPRIKHRRKRPLRQLDESGRMDEKPFLMVPNDFIDYLFPFLDSAFKTRKVSNVFIALLRLRNIGSDEELAFKAYPGFKELARMTAQNPSSVQAAILVLEYTGIVKKARRAGDSNTYEFDEQKARELTIGLMRYNNVRFSYDKNAESDEGDYG